MCIKLVYQHDNSRPPKETYIERVMEKINSKGGFRVGSFTKIPECENRRVPIEIVEKLAYPDRIDITCAPSTLRGDPDSRIFAKLNRGTGKEKVLIPFGWCDFHGYLEKRGYETIQ